MDRRLFVTGASAMVANACFNGSAAYAQDYNNPLLRLTDIASARKYRPEPDRHPLVLFMTAQQMYPSCGGAFIGVHQIIEFTGAGDKIQPILVMPKVTDQLEPERHENLSRITTTYRQLGFKILTGELSDMRRVSQDYGGVFDIDPVRRKVTGHTLDMLFLKPLSGQVLLRHRADDYHMSYPQVDALIKQCAKPENADLCL